MPTIINDLEIVADPPGAEEEGGAPLTSAGAESESQPPALSPVVIRQVLEREAARAARVFAH